MNISQAKAVAAIPYTYVRLMGTPVSTVAAGTTGWSIFIVQLLTQALSVASAALTFSTGRITYGPPVAGTIKVSA